MPIQVKEVILTAVQLVGRDDLAPKISGSQSDTEVTLLLRCFNLVENEIALDYLPLKKRERFTPQAKKLSYTLFAEAPIDVLSITDIAGMDVSYELFPDTIHFAKEIGEVEVTYAYAPREKVLSDSSDFTEKVSIRTFALGVATEFLLAHGLYAEASSFEKRYREALRAMGRMRRKLSVRARRWA